MVPPPIVIKCECGVETRGTAGSLIHCQGCGLKYDTASEAQMLETVAAKTQRQFRYLSRAGIGLVGLCGLGGLYLYTTPGLLVGAAIGAVFWYVLLMPFMKKRMIAKATSLYTPTISPHRK